MLFSSSKLSIRLTQAAGFVGLLVLAGCQGAGNVPQQMAASGAPELSLGQPMQLMTSGTAGGVGVAGDGSGSIRQPLDERLLAKGVERYRLNKKMPKSPYQSVGVDLNGDGQPEAVVLMEGEKWCAKTGCTLAILTKGRTGYRPVATIRRVRAPVLVANERRNGWSSLVVETGLPGPRANRVWLRFGAKGYPGNAVTQTPMPADIEVSGEVVLEKPNLQPQDLASASSPGVRP